MFKTLASRSNVLRQGSLLTRSFSTTPLASQARVQGIAPAFTSKAVINNKIQDLSLSDFEGKWKILVAVPLAFTFNCPTELNAFSDAVDKFEKLDAKVIGLSVDSPYSLLAWSQMGKKEGGLGGGLKYPIVSDLTHTISRDYGILIEEEGIALRGTFIIDPTNKIRHISINDLAVARQVEPVLQTLEAFQFADKHGVVCPVNFHKDRKVIVPDPEKSKEYFNSL